MENQADKTAPIRYYSNQEARSGGRSDGPIAPEAPGGGVARWAGSTPRARLIKAVGLAYDPFSSGVSEKDLAPDFGSIYVDMQPGLLSELQQPGPGFVFADYGMGKTATRMALEYALRLARHPMTLSATYTPSIAQQTPPAESLLQQHLDAIAIEVRIDLLVQYLERLPERQAEREATAGPLQQLALYRQARSLPTRFSAAMRTALANPGEDGAFWRAFRPNVRYVPVTTAWRSLVETMVKAARSSESPRASWEETVYDARSLGFQQIYVLVDAIDEGRSSDDAYLEVVQPLIKAASDLARQGIYLKCFFPLELKELLLNENTMLNGALTLPPAIAIINSISPADLEKLITDRIEAAGTSGASIRSLDWFGQELDESIQARLITAASGSPRRLIELTSALLDFHSLNGFRHEERLWLTRAEWQQFLEAVERPAPPLA